jgi:hypothetical protein
MRIDMFPAKGPHGLKASFFFGTIGGTMLLAMCKRDVALLREKQPKHYSKFAEDSDDNGYQDTVLFDEGNEAAKSLPQTGEKRSLGHIADPYGVQAARAKRKKPNEKANDPKQRQQPHPNRVYFQLGCSEVPGYPLRDEGNRHVGHLDFDETGLAAKGVFYLPACFGKEAQSISIFKVAERPEWGKEPEPWYWYNT